MTHRWFPIQRVLAFLLSFVFLLAACNRSVETPTPSSKPATPTPAAAATVTGSSHEGHETTAIADDAGLVATLYEMLGHLEASRANLERGNWTLAQAHAAHPTAEYWAAVESALARHGLTAIRDPLDANLRAARDQATDALAANDTARQALHDAIARLATASPDGTALRAAALASLAEAVATELAEGVEGGTIVNIEEFQDAWGFFQVLQRELPEIVSQAPESGKAAAAEAAEDLETLAAGPLAQFHDQPGAQFGDLQPIQERLRHLAAELRSAFGIRAPEASSVSDRIAEIHAMLDRSLELYRGGQADAAYEQAANAYLEGFEQLEAPLLDAGHRDLVERLELDFKAVRDAIREGKPADEVAQLIDEVKSGLEEVEEVLQ
ncbi:MAG: hypothetical protein N2Z82_10095 [Thermomicrobium sp.]|nr:hypothetical protein [Thermomicrobium sp.]